MVHVIDDCDAWRITRKPAVDQRQEGDDALDRGARATGGEQAGEPGISEPLAAKPSESKPVVRELPAVDFGEWKPFVHVAVVESGLPILRDERCLAEIDGKTGTMVFVPLNIDDLYLVGL